MLFLEYATYVSTPLLPLTVLNSTCHLFGSCECGGKAEIKSLKERKKTHKFHLAT